MILTSKYMNEDKLHGQDFRPMTAVEFRNLYEMGGISRNLEFWSVWYKIPQS